MRSLSVSIATIVAALLLILTYSVAAQSSVRSSGCCCSMNSSPAARDIRSFFHEYSESDCAVDLFTVPMGKVFVFTEVHWFRTQDFLTLRENGENGSVRTVLVPNNLQRTFTPGIPFGPGSVITLQRVNCTGTQTPLVTVVGYLADA